MMIIRINTGDATDMLAWLCVLPPKSSTVFVHGCQKNTWPFVVCLMQGWMTHRHHWSAFMLLSPLSPFSFSLFFPYSPFPPVPLFSLSAFPFPPIPTSKYYLPSSTFNFTYSIFHIHVPLSNFQVPLPKFLTLTAKEKPRYHRYDDSDAPLTDGTLRVRCVQSKIWRFKSYDLYSF